jgi:DNA recombination protein RmuC
MNEILLVAGLLLLVAVVVLQLVLLLRNPNTRHELLERAIRDELRAGRDESVQSTRQLREDIASRVTQLTESNETRLERLRVALAEQLRLLQEGNEKKLDQMRATVDEKLQGTLEKRLGESFKIVSDRLEAVHRGLGEMQTLAADVGGLKRVLTNVKVRGTFGEVQLGALLEQMLTPDQYARNVAIQPNSREIVEYAVRLPGHEQTVWLPIDSKFPQEDYLRLQAAAQAGDKEAETAALDALGRAILKAAKDIQAKYIHPPHSTDFAILFVPTESLYAEVLRNEGLVQKLQQECRVVISGPSTLAAMLSSLRMGFRTLVIEQRSSEVWRLLAAVKAEFASFAGVLASVKKQLDTARKTIDLTDVRTRQMERKLKDVESMPEDQARETLGFNEMSRDSDEDS